MHWLFLILAIGAMAVGLRTSSMAVMVVSLLVALALFVAWVMGWFSARVGSSSAGHGQIVDPAELRRLRELAAARKTAAEAGKEPPSP